MHTNNLAKKYNSVITTIENTKVMSIKYIDAILEKPPITFISLVLLQFTISFTANITHIYDILV